MGTNDTTKVELDQPFGDRHGRIAGETPRARLAKPGFDKSWQRDANPVVCLVLQGRRGSPVRTTGWEPGPTLLASKPDSPACSS